MLLHSSSCVMRLALPLYQRASPAYRYPRQTDGIDSYVPFTISSNSPDAIMAALSPRACVSMQELSRLEGSLSALWTPVETSLRRSPTLLDSEFPLQPCLQVRQSVMLPRLPAQLALV